MHLTEGWSSPGLFSIKFLLLFLRFILTCPDSLQVIFLNGILNLNRWIHSDWIFCAPRVGWCFLRPVCKSDSNSKKKSRREVAPGFAGVLRAAEGNTCAKSYCSCHFTLCWIVMRNRENGLPWTTAAVHTYIVMVCRLSWGHAISSSATGKSNIAWCMMHRYFSPSAFFIFFFCFFNFSCRLRI